MSNKRNLYNILKTSGLFGIALSVGILEYTENSKDIKSICETYQGYEASNSETDLLYNFDPLQVYFRTKPAEWGIWGEQSLKKELEIGKKYCFKFKEAKLPLQKRKFVSNSIKEIVD